MINKNGDTYWVEIRGKIVEDRERFLKVVGVSREITARKRVEQRQEDLNRQLADALAEKERLIQEIKVLKTLLPICSGCRRIRDDHGKWWPLEAYVREHTHSDFTHTICGDCETVLYPEIKSGR